MINLYNDDCLNAMKDIKDKSIDMILCDLPYGILKFNKNKQWDNIIPFGLLWEQYDRIIKDNGCIALFSKQPFTSLLCLSNINNFRYELIWQKDKGTDFGNSNRKPLYVHENILIFYKKPPCYNKITNKGTPYYRKTSHKIIEMILVLEVIIVANILTTEHAVRYL